MSIVRDIQRLLSQKNNGLYWLIFINTLFFLFANLLSALAAMGNLNAGIFLDLFYLPSDISKAFSQPWSFITYMFLHKELFHFVFNMLWLYWFGQLYENQLGKRRLIETYLVGGLAGGLLYLILGMGSILGDLHLHYLLGASASVMAIVIALAFYQPDTLLNLMFIGPVKLKYVALGSLILTSFVDLSNNTGGKIAHIGGAMVGMLTYLFYNGDLGLGQLFNRKTKMKVTHRRPVSDEEFNAEMSQLNRTIENLRTLFQNITYAHIYLNIINSKYFLIRI